MPVAPYRPSFAIQASKGTRACHCEPAGPHRRGNSLFHPILAARLVGTGAMRSAAVTRATGLIELSPGRRGT